jgi:NAD(P)-dependent dehydrogenase (short-subunit alcohol dehydrogenase family)
MIKTPMTIPVEDLDANKADIESGLYPFGWGEPNDVANMIVYLLSDKAKFISGQNYVIDSGGAL